MRTVAFAPSAAYLLRMAPPPLLVLAANVIRPLAFVTYFLTGVLAGAVVVSVAVFLYVRAVFLVPDSTARGRPRSDLQQSRSARRNARRGLRARKEANAAAAATGSGPPVLFKSQAEVQQSCPGMDGTDIAYAAISQGKRPHGT